MKIVVLDGYTENPGDLSWEGLEALGELTVYEHTDASEVAQRIGDAPYVYTNKTPITRETMDACPNLKFIGVLATGYNIVDVEAAKEKGIPVCNIPTYGTTAVSQFAMALLLEIAHHVGAHSDAVKKGDWENCKDWCFWNYPLFELAGKTFGIIGAGRIGYATAKIANAFGMKILAYDIYPNKSLESEWFHFADLDTVLKESDVLSLHCPLFESTKEIIRKENIDKMKDGAIIINTSRGPLINEDDLDEALNSGKIFAAAVDVLSVEPPRGHNKLIANPRCITTPHIAWAPKESRQRLMDIAVDNLKQFIAGNVVNAVNMK